MHVCIYYIYIYIIYIYIYIYIYIHNKIFASLQELHRRYEILRSTTNKMVKNSSNLQYDKCITKKHAI